MPIPNNITRMLDQRKIRYTAFELPIEKMSAIEVANRLEIPHEHVYKSIVVSRVAKGKAILAVIPGPKEVDLKALARVLGEKKLLLPTEKEAENITGLQAGGISPLALINRGFQVILDDSAQTLDELHISGGERGLNIRLSVKALAELTKARLAPISR